MYSQETVLRLIGLIYEAALQPDRWAACLEAIGETVGGHALSLAHYDSTKSIANLEVTARFDPKAIQEYREHFASRDPWAKAGREHNLFRPGVVALGTDFLPDEVYEETDFWKDYGSRYGISGGVTAVLAAEGSLLALFNVSRLPGRVFGEPERVLIKTLAPHFVRALEVHRRVAEAEAHARAAEDVLNRLSQNVVVLDPEGTAVFINQPAKRLLATRDGLLLERNELRAARAQETTKLRALIARAIQQASGRDVSAPDEPMLVTRPSMKRPLQLLVAPLRLAPDAAASLPHAAAVVFITDPGASPPSDESLLAAFFALTSTEAHFAAMLLKDLTIAEAAEELDVTVSTARTHLRRLFEKTGTHQQSHLVRLLATSLAQLQKT